MISTLKNGAKKTARKTRESPKNTAGRASASHPARKTKDSAIGMRIERVWIEAQAPELWAGMLVVQRLARERKEKR